MTLDTERFTRDGPAVGLADDGVVTIAWQTRTHAVLTTRLGSDGTWEEPMTVAELGHRAWPLALAVDGAGDAVLAWRLRDHTVQAAFRPANGSWGLVEDVATQASWGLGLGIAANGDVLVAWNDDEDVVRARWRQAGSVR